MSYQKQKLQSEAWTSAPLIRRILRSKCPKMLYCWLLPKCCQRIAKFQLPIAQWIHGHICLLSSLGGTWVNCCIVKLRSWARIRSQKIKHFIKVVGCCLISSQFAGDRKMGPVTSLTFWVYIDRPVSHLCKQAASKPTVWLLKMNYWAALFYTLDDISSFVDRSENWAPLPGYFLQLCHLDRIHIYKSNYV